MGYAAAADSDADIKTTVAASAKESDENIKSEDNKLLKDETVYVIADNKWAKYSMSDDVLFKKRASLEEIL